MALLYEALTQHDSGGTILDLLLNSKEPWTRGLKISALARKEDHVTKIKELGVEAIPFDGFDDTAFLRQVAADFDGSSNRRRPCSEAFANV